MCGRFSLFAAEEDIKKEYNLFSNIQFSKRYNIAPGQEIPIVISNDEDNNNKVINAYWGFIPEWTRSIKDITKPINAKSETLHEKLYFRQAFAQKRCLIPTNGFYEWDKRVKPSLPLRYRFPENRLFTFAGLWSLWKDKNSSKDIFTCAIITNPANTLINPVHDRMPAILTKEEYADWLNPKTELGKLRSLLKTKELEEFEVYPVSTFINKPQNNNPTCIEAV